MGLCACDVSLYILQIHINISSDTSRSFFNEELMKTPYSLPVRVRNGASFMSTKSDLRRFISKQISPLCSTSPSGCLLYTNIKVKHGNYHAVCTITLYMTAIYWESIVYRVNAILENQREEILLVANGKLHLCLLHLPSGNIWLTHCGLVTVNTGSCNGLLADGFKPKIKF